MLGDETTAPPVWNSHLRVRLSGPDWPSAVWAGSWRNMGHPTVPIAQIWLAVEYSFPDIVSTAVVTSPGMRYRLP